MSELGSVLEVADPSLTHPYQVTSSDGLMTHSVYIAESIQEQTTLAVETTFPEGTRDWDVKAALDPNPDFDSPNSELLGLTTPEGAIYEFGEVARFTSVLRALGYDWSSNESTEDSVTTRRGTFTYPSTETLNTNVARIFPSAPITFVPFKGGRFTTEDLLIPLAEAGEVIVPTEQPWQLHDHAVKHILGFIAMGEDFVEPMQRNIKQWFVRDAAEATLPEVPGLGDDRVDQFLRPSQAVLKHLMVKIDDHTYGIAQAIVNGYIPVGLAGGKERKKWEKTIETVERFWTEGKYGHTRGASYEVPPRTLTEHDWAASDKLAQTMWERFEYAEAIALSEETK